MIQLQVVQGNIVQQEADCIVVNLFAGVTEPAGATGALDRALDGAIRRLIQSGDFSGEAGTTATLYTSGQIPAPRVLVVGLGPQERFDLHAARKAAATAARALGRMKGVRRFATVVHGGGAGGLEPTDAAQALAEGTLLADYTPPQYKREPQSSHLETCTVVEFDAARVDAVAAGVQAGQAIATGVYRARDYISEPPNVLTPVEFARRAQAMAEEVGLRCTVLGEAEMRELKMGMLLAVSQGSANEAQLIILEHAPAGSEAQQPLVLVGKGITFDTGGISLKPSANMWYMKDDMSGAAAVIGALEAIARLGLPRRVIGVAACVENMPDGAAYRPGDILTSMTGKTAEIISTDAEGRLVLADALGYVARFNPAAVVDLATLTGAIGVALGTQAAGLFANDEALQQALLGAADRSGERLWPMPLYDEYKEEIKSDMAEVKNSGGRDGGVATSAKFLEHFTEGYPWAHLDIAAMAWAKSDQNPLIPKGAAGYGVRLLVELAKAY
ncbi:leucyl aminopeptidase [Litorilinea aerophila]|uniref:Probable cytosol aminopeptidase n=1 Tax=Litorilinea aerophila TaxID=1204385 RepID=A0A540VC78_9CHLR|nr:leucyl aminopeptidase [Litorilinea aerophila]MCC9077756.1 leucyl aminopeptidase [Litorilinea aerophila]